MKTPNVAKTVTLVLALAGVFSCDDENRLTRADLEDITEDAVTDAYFEDADDLGSVSMSAATETELNGSGAGRERDTITITVTDTRRCIGSGGIDATLVRMEDSTPTTPHGILVIDFGDGCTDIRGNVRSGKLIFEYTGKRFQPNSILVMTTEDYFINEVQLEGTRTLTNISGSTENAPKFSIELVDGKATFPDGRVATREAFFTREWIRADNPLNDELRVEGNASGSTRNERSYEMEIVETLVFERNCEYRLPVTGVKTFVTEGKTITINYGDGECDRSVTYTVGDRTVTTVVGNN